MIASRTMWALLWSIPAAVVWMLLHAMLFIGWGVKVSDGFVLAWNKFVDEGDFRLPVGEDG